MFFSHPFAEKYRNEWNEIPFTLWVFPMAIIDPLTSLSLSSTASIEPSENHSLISYFFVVSVPLGASRYCCEIAERFHQLNVPAHPPRSLPYCFSLSLSLSLSVLVGKSVKRFNPQLPKKRKSSETDGDYDSISVIKSLRSLHAREKRCPNRSPTLVKL